MTSTAQYVDSHDHGGQLTLVTGPRRFYIDDILASDFGHRPLDERRLVSAELDEHHRTAAAKQRDRPNIVDSTTSPNVDTSSEFDKSTDEPAVSNRLSTTALSSRRLEYKGNLADTSSCCRRPVLKDTVKVEPCRSTNTEVTSKNDIDKSGTICDVTSSTTSHSVEAMLDKKPALKADNGKDCATLPAWVYCTRYSDRPSAGPRIRRKLTGRRRRRTAFSGDQLRQLRTEYDRCRYISDDRRRQLADRLGLHVTTIKIWFQNRRASDKKASGVCNQLALRLMAEGLYDHHTINLTTPTS